VRKALLGLLVAAISCSDFALVEPEPAAPAEPSMSVLLRADRSASSRYELSAFFFRGLDSRGRAGELADRVLYVEGNALQPSPESGSELWHYDWEETRADGGVQADSLRIRPPVLAGSPLPGITVTIPIPGRAGPGDVTWAEGEDLRLHISPAIGATPQLSGGPIDWRLELGDACGGAGTSRALFVTGRGAYPPELRVPWEWLLSATPAPTAACLRALSSYRVSNAPYRMDVFVELQLAWRIRVAGTNQTSWNSSSPTPPAKAPVPARS
jgi:hypothetical protein